MNSWVKILTLYIIITFLLSGGCQTNHSTLSNDFSATAKPPFRYSKPLTINLLWPQLPNDTNRVYWGGLFNGFSDDKEIDLLNQFGLKYVRAGTTLSEWKISNKMWTKFTDKGFRVLFNIGFEPQGPDGHFATDTIAYKIKLRTILNSRPLKGLDIVVIENEETNKGYRANYSINLLKQYFNELRAAVTVCNELKVKVTNGGGMYYLPLRNLTYLYYLNTGQSSKAILFANKAGMTPFEMRQALADTMKLQVEAKLMLPEYAKMKLDYINIHLHHPVKIALPEIIDYVRRVTGKNVISNEVSQNSTNEQQTNDIIDAIISSRLQYAIWYATDGEITRLDRAIGLVDSSGNERVNGVSFINHLHAYRELGWTH